jgi:phenylalanyl-tRNA synthetase beta chain
VVQGVRIGPSPDWLRNILEKVGLRSINNVVDVTNFVMLETGHPLHAFDYHLISRGCARESAANQDQRQPPSHDGSHKPTIVIRRAEAGEKFTTLDEQEHELSTDMLLIADEQKGIALAGVMGGLNTEINDQTTDVLIESAYFNPSNIRRTSKALGLRSESSYRFERGCDPNWGVEYASRRAAQLILETGGGLLAEGLVDAYPQPIQPKDISLRFAKTTELLGVGIQPEQQCNLLTSLGLTGSGSRTPQSGIFSVPTFRPDIKREVDLIEEIVRLYGVDNIPSTPPRGAIGSNPFDAVYDQLADVRRVLTAQGLDEAQGQTLVSRAEIRNPKSESELAALANPLSSDMDVLRPSLLPGLIRCLQHNIHHKNPDVALFEIGRVFEKTGGEFNELRRLGIALTGARDPGFWSGENRGAKFDSFDLKGIIEELLEELGIRGVAFTRRDENSELFLESATLALGGKLPLGEMGQLSPRLAKENDLRDPVFLAELDLDQLLARQNPSKSFKPLPQFPAIRRDVAMLVMEDVTHESVLGVVRKAKPANLESVEVFDVFRGKNVPKGQKSLAYAFTYRSQEKTLTDAEASAAHANVIKALKEQLQVILRE